MISKMCLPYKRRRGRRAVVDCLNRELFRCDEVALLKLMHDYHVSYGWTKARQYCYGLKNERNVVWPSKALSEKGFNRDLVLNEGGEFFRVEKALKNCLQMPSGANTSLIAKSKALLAEREAIVKARDQKKVDAWRLAVGRAIDSLVRHLDTGK